MRPGSSAVVSETGWLPSVRTLLAVPVVAGPLLPLLALPAVILPPLPLSSLSLRLIRRHPHDPSVSSYSLSLSLLSLRLIRQHPETCQYSCALSLLSVSLRLPKTTRMTCQHAGPCSRLGAMPASLSFPTHSRMQCDIYSVKDGPII